MGVGTRLLLLLIVVCLTQGNKFDINTRKDGFEISVNGIQILYHSHELPAILVGKAKTTFTEHLGNYDIEENEEEKAPCLSYDLLTAKDEARGEVCYLSLTTPRGELVKFLLRSDEQHDLIIETVEIPEPYNRVWLRIPAHPQEAVYGGGEQFSHFNLRGRDYPIWVREQGAGRDPVLPVSYLAEMHHAKGASGAYHTTYFPQSTFVSSRHYYVHVEGYNYAHLDFRNPSYHELVFQDKPGRLLLNTDISMKGLVSKLTDYLKRQPALPDWVGDGVILGIQGGTEKMYTYLDTARQAGLPVSGIWIQDWSGSIYTSFGKRVFWNWQWSPDTYPGLDKEIPKLKQEGVRLLAYINAHFNTEGLIFKTVDKFGYFVKNSTGQTYIQDFGEFSCATVDLTHPEAYDWFKKLMIRNLVKMGFGGWMADFGEYLPVDAVYNSGADPVQLHNKFPVLWAKINYEVLKETNTLGDIMVFMRAGGTGSSEYTTMMWAGDQNVDWSYSDGLATTVPAALSFAMSGIGRTHFDIGGYTTVSAVQQLGNLHIVFNMTRTRELFFRYAETAVFTPVMRTHEGNLPSVNYQVYTDPSGLKEFTRLVSVFIKLKPYRKYLEEEYQTEGLPLQRPLFLHYDTDPVTYTLEYQYMFGSDVIVAPVIDSGKTDCTLYLPDDSWVHIFTGEEHTGPQWVTVDAPLGTPTAFYKKSSSFASLFSSFRDLQGQCDRETCP